MQEIALNWTLYGWTLAGAFIFGILFSLLIHWASKRQIVGQTAFAVVIGVTATLLIAIPFFGLDIITFLFPYFIASGIPMIGEYVLRVAREAEEDAKKAKGIAKDLFQ